MTDLFFPDAKVLKADELRLIMAVRYFPATVVNASNFFSVAVQCMDFKTIVSKPISVPKYYHEHLRRFIWRHHLFMELHERADSLQFAPGLDTRLQQYIFYMDGMVEGLLTTVQKNVGNPRFRSCLFNMYLAVEYFVGRHEYDVCDEWRVSNPHLILERQNIDQLDWTQFYATKDRTDPVWSGSAYGFRAAKVSDGDWKGLADRATTYFGLANQPAT